MEEALRYTCLHCCHGLHCCLQCIFTFDMVYTVDILYTVHMVDTVDTVDNVATVDTVDTVYTIPTAKAHYGLWELTPLALFTMLPSLRRLTLLAHTNMYEQ